MGDIRGFITLRRASPSRQPVGERVRHWGEFYNPMPAQQVQEQGARCMDCGVPFCQGDTGCPVHNVIPDWNDLVYRNRWHAAIDALHATNNFPEFTGRLCPAPCESACVLGLIEQPVAIRNIEQAIADRAFDEGWVTSQPPARETGRAIAIVGSGPAGLAAAQQLRRLGHAVTVFEKSDRLGGLLRYGIPEFKMEKAVLDRRLHQLAAEGVVFRTGVNVGVDLTVDALRLDFDAVLLAGGAQRPRDLPVAGRELRGVHLAMDYLEAQNRVNEGDAAPLDDSMNAAGKHVVVIGGGDTGSDCAGTAHRQGALSVKQFELMPAPPTDRHDSTPWPLWPMMVRSSHAHEEGCAREWSLSTKSFGGADGQVRALHTVRVQCVTDADGRQRFVEIGGSESVIEADLVVLALGFTGPTDTAVMTGLGVDSSDAGLVATDSSYATNVDGVFAAGDVRRGASLIVWAIREGRDAAAGIDGYLERSARAMREVISPALAATS